MKIISRDLVCTKYIGPTNHRDARIAIAQGSATMRVTWDERLGFTENHAEAALAFLRTKRPDLGAVALEPLLVPDASPYAYAFLVVGKPDRRSK